MNATDLDVRNAAGTSTIHARCVVVTVPLGVLQQRSGATPLSFVPPLPEEKQNALRGLEMGHAARVTLAFRTPFWEELADGRYFEIESLAAGSSVTFTAGPATGAPEPGAWALLLASLFTTGALLRRRAGAAAVA